MSTGTWKIDILVLPRMIFFIWLLFHLHGSNEFWLLVAYLSTQFKIELEGKRRL